MSRTPTAGGADGLAAFACGLCHSTIPDEPAVTPYFMYLVAHPEGYVLFDCGLPVEHLVGASTVVVEGLAYRIEATNDNSVLALLDVFTLTPTDVAALVISHLHFDHAGGIPLLGKVRTLIQRDELSAAHDQPGGESLWVRPPDQSAGGRVVELEGDHDIFGDASVVILQASGHTPGHQCLFVRLQTGDCFVLAADIVYYPSQFRTREIPANAWSEEASLASCERVARVMDETGARLLLSHDPAFRRTVRLAPESWYGTLPTPRGQREP